MSVPNASALLHHNLIFLGKFVRMSKVLVTCLKEGMFNHPNRQGFEEVMYYLLYAYDPKRCATQVTWPLVERSHERSFRKDIVVYVKDIAVERPEAKIPNFSPSFLTTPGGDRFVRFVWKLSLVVLKAVVERLEAREPTTPLLEFPRRNHQLFQRLACGEMEELKPLVMGLNQLLIDACRKSKESSEEILNLAGELKSARANLKDLVDVSPFPGVKIAALKGDENVFSSEVNDCQSHIRSKLTEVIDLQTLLKEYHKIVFDCQNIVQQFVDSRSNPIVLDAAALYPNSKDPLKLTDLMLESSQAVQEICQRLLECGGMQRIEHQLLPLNNVNNQLQNLKSNLRDILTGFLEFLNKLSVSTYEHHQNREESPPRTLRLNDGYKLLQDASLVSPVIEFNINTQLKPKCALDTESPPIGGVVDALRAQRKRDPVNGNGAAITPFSLRRPPLILSTGRKNFQQSKAPMTQQSKGPMTPVTSGVSAYSARMNMSRLRTSTMIPISTQSSLNPSSPFLALHTPAKLSLKSPTSVKSVLKSTNNGKETFRPSVTSTLFKNPTQHKFAKKKDVLQEGDAFSQNSKLKVAGNKSLGEAKVSLASVDNNVDTTIVNARRLSIRSKPSDDENSDLQEILDLVTETLSSNKAIDDDAVWLQSVSSKAPEFSTSAPKVDLLEDVTPVASPAVDSEKKTNRTSAKKRNSLLKTVLSRSPSASPRSPVSLGAQRKSQAPISAPLILGSSPIKSVITSNGALLGNGRTLSTSPRVESKILRTPQKLVPKLVVSDCDSNAAHGVEAEPSEFDSPDEPMAVYSFDASDGDMNGSLFISDIDDEHISPSGRLSWEPEPMGVQKIVKETAKDMEVQRPDQKEADKSEDETNLVKNITVGKPAAGERRKSLLAVIERYHKLVGTRSDREKHAMPELESRPHDLETSTHSDLDNTTELGLGTHNISIDIDLDLNL